MTQNNYIHGKKYYMTQSFTQKSFAESKVDISQNMILFQFDT